MTKQKKTLLSIIAVTFILIIVSLIAVWQYLRRKPAPQPVAESQSISTKRDIPVNEVIKLALAVVGVVRQVIELRKQMA